MTPRCAGRCREATEGFGSEGLAEPARPEGLWTFPQAPLSLTFFEKKVSKEALNVSTKKHLLTGHTHTGQQVLVFYDLILICKVAEGLGLLDDLALQHLGQGLIADEIKGEVTAALRQLTQEGGEILHLGHGDLSLHDL